MLLQGRFTARKHEVLQRKLEGVEVGGGGGPPPATSLLDKLRAVAYSAAARFLLPRGARKIISTFCRELTKLLNVRLGGENPRFLNRKNIC